MQGNLLAAGALPWIMLHDAGRAYSAPPTPSWWEWGWLPPLRGHICRIQRSMKCSVLGLRSMDVYSKLHARRVYCIEGLPRRGNRRKWRVQQARTSTTFVTARCYASAILAMGLCPSVCLCPSVTSRSSTKTDKHSNRITQTTPHDSPGTLVFWRQRSPRNSNGVIPYEGVE